MDSFWFAAYLILAGLAVGQSLLLTLQTWEHRRYARSCMGNLHHQQPTGRAVVFVPCKGIDVEGEENLRALLNQDYHDYEVTFVVESEDDPACPLIRRVMADHPGVVTRLVIAGRATDSGQKVHNLRAATAKLSPQIKYLAFLDSDARPRREWLRVLLGRLHKPGFGAVTGYRWFVPERPSTANHLVYSINCDVMSLLGRNSHYLIWGGSWGIRREVFDSIGLHAEWQGTLSDDLVASRLLRRVGLHVRFEPACVVASPLHHSTSQMFSFIRRQYLVVRFYVPSWWVFAVAAATLSAVAWVGNLAALGCGLVCGTPPVWAVAPVCAWLYLTSVCRGVLRQDLVNTYFPRRQKALRRAGRFDTSLGPLVALVNWLGVLGSMFGRHITWRGISYRVSAGGKIRIVRREDLPSAGHGTCPTDRLEQLPTENKNDRDQPDANTPTPAPYRKAG